MARGRSRKRVLLIGATLAVIALVGLAFAMLQPGAPAEPEFDLVEVTRSPQSVTLPVSGEIAPRTQANLSFRVAGTVTEVSAKVGQKVRTGTILATIDPTDLRAAVSLAEAQKSAARAQLSTARSTSGVRQAQIDAAVAGVDSAEAALTNARDRLAWASLTSPIAGTVARVSLDVGDQVGGGMAASLPVDTGGFDLGSLTGGVASSGQSTGAEVVVIGDDGWQLEAQVGTVDLPDLKEGLDAVVTPTGTNQQLAGRISSVGISATGSGAQAMFPVVIEITDIDAKLFSGASADAVVTVETVPDALSIPIAAVSTVDGQSTVIVDSNGKPTQTDVALGRRFDTRVEVVDGLAAGTMIRVPRARVITEPKQEWGPPMATATASPSPGR